MIKNLIIGALAIGFVAWVMSACSSNRQGNHSDKEKPILAVSIPPQLFFVKAIAGDRVGTVCLLGNSGDPESFEPSIGQLVDLEKADIYMPIGTLPFEKSLLGRLQSNNPDIKVQPVSEGVKLLSGTHGHHHNQDSDVDPHIWSSVSNSKVMALNTLNALISIDSINEDIYRANYGRLAARIDSIDSHFRKIFPSIQDGPSFLVWHPSLSYFARDYGLRQIAMAEAGKDSSVRGLRNRLEEALASDAKVCFFQKGIDSSRAMELTAETGVKVVEINPMNEEWEDEMQKLYDAFTLN